MTSTKRFSPEVRERAVRLVFDQETEHFRPWALGRSNWLFAGSLRSGQRAANVMTLIQSAKINGLDPQAYLSDVLERLPTAKQSDLNG
jgi:hypothetical protein